MGARQCYSIGVEGPAAGGEDTALSNGVAGGGRLRLHPDVTQWRIALARTPRNQKTLGVAGPGALSLFKADLGSRRSERHAFLDQLFVQHAVKVSGEPKSTGCCVEHGRPVFKSW